MYFFAGIVLAEELFSRDSFSKGSFSRGTFYQGQFQQGQFQQMYFLAGVLQFVVVAEVLFSRDSFSRGTLSRGSFFQQGQFYPTRKRNVVSISAFKSLYAKLFLNKIVYLLYGLNKLIILCMHLVCCDMSVQGYHRKFPQKIWSI